MKPVKVLGIGSPFGDDQIGWRVVQCLAELGYGDGANHRPRCELSCLDRPGAMLIAELASAERVVIVDALRDDGPAGNVVELPASSLARDDPELSGHALGVVAALELLDALGELPDVLRLVAVTIDRVGQGFELSPQAAAAVPVAVAAVERIVAEI